MKTHIEISHEAKATPMERVDDPLRLTGITHCLARCPDVGVQRRLADELLGSQLLQ
jgi:hypothetical protein